MDEVEAALMVEEDEEYDWWDANCSIIYPELSRLILVGVVGAVIAFTSVCFNTFLFCVLFRNKRHRSSHVLYLIFLAMADVFLSASYILLFPINLYMDYFESDILASAWWTYMRMTITVSHVFISTSAFLIVAAAFERYVTIAKLRNQFARRHRCIISLMAVFFAFLAKSPMYFEVQVIPNGNCTGVTSWTATVAEFSEMEPYKTFYKYWFRNIFTIFIPFAMCFYLNFEIIRRLREQHQGAKLFRFATSEHRQNIRSATLMLVFVTCTYLASNLLNVIVYTWELIDKPSLMSEQLRPFYTLSSDLVSLFTVLASCTRLPIYIACNSRIRCEVFDALENIRTIRLKVTGSKSSTPTKAKRLRPMTTIRYCDTGNGFMIYETTKKGEARVRSVGTGLDKIVLSVAMGGIRHKFPSTPVIDAADD
ncbi:unnamed protein product [Auanema sp. JU1783]|nr:unnamed protein product [Auanema sp. JU1783]